MFKAVVASFLLLVTTAQAQEVIPGLIPRFYAIEAATDLPLSAEVAHAQALNGLDLSKLEPDTTTNIWKPSQNSIPLHKLISAGEEVRFVRELPSRSGQLRFTVEASGRELILVLSKKIHNTLLRRNILAKLGYNTQPMNWVSNLTLNFDSTIDRDLFKVEMKDKLLAGTDRWIRSEAGLKMVIQDALVQTPETDIYNLALGLMPQTVHQGRRLLRAPYVPLALVDATESINLMPWQAGRVILDNLKLNHTQDLEPTFGTSWEDARWIGRRMGKLTREDFIEIIQKASFPKAVELLLVEKIISRRNDLMKLLNLTEFQELAFFPDVSFEDKLKDGEIVQEFFTGYSSRFSYGDPESPFSASELGSFALSRVQSQVIETGITKLNTFLGTADQDNYGDKIKEIVKNQGPFFPVQGLLIPTFHGSIILSRDIVTGSYMGTNNKVQLVDNIGVAVDAGVFAGVEGGPIPFGLKGGANLSFQRVYSHVKPVQSLKKSIKEPYKNMLVPLVIRNMAKKIDDLDTVTGDAQVALMTSVIGELKSALAVGESFIITDSLVPKIFAEGSLSLSMFMFLDPAMLKVNAKIQSERMMLTRFHFHRASDNVFHVYQDYGKNLKLMLTLKLKSYVPIIAINGRWNTATAQTHFYPINLSPREATVEKLKALRQSLLALNHGALQDVIKPHHIDHEVKGAGNTLQLLIFKRNQSGSDQGLKLTHAVGGAKKEINRRYDAVTAGTDYESYATEAVNDLMSVFLKTDFTLSQVPTLNPGFTLGGKAKNKVFASETDGERMTTSFQRIFNGWKVKPKKLNQFLKQMNDEVGEVVFNPLSVINTDSILLYQIQFIYSMTQEGIDGILKSTPAQIKAILKKHAQNIIDPENLDGIASSFHRDLLVINTELLSDPNSGMKKLHSWLKSFQSYVTIKGLATLAGKENIAYQGRIDGFRQGDEGGDAAIFSHVYGQLPLALQSTPTQRVIQNWGILEGELLLNYVVERAI